MLNEVAGRANFGGTPETLVARKKDLGAFVSGLDSEDITALFSNPTLDGGFLGDFFEQEEPWQVLDEGRRLAAIHALQKNPRMSAEYEGPMDGYAEYRHNRVFTAAWGLAAKVPPTAEWASALAWLYDKTMPEASLDQGSLTIARRWVPDPSDADRIKGEKEDLDRGRLGVFALMRKQLARLALGAALSREARLALSSHDDIAVRAAFYAYADLSEEEMASANERDVLLGFEQMVWNERAWRTRKQRDLLHDMAWDNKRDPNNYMDPQNMYEARREFFLGKYPGWFEDDERGDKDNADTGPVNVGTFNAAMADLKRDLFTNTDLVRSTYMAVSTLAAPQSPSEPSVRPDMGADNRPPHASVSPLVPDIHAAVNRLLTRTAWLAWGLVAALAILLFKSM